MTNFRVLCIFLSLSLVVLISGCQTQPPRLEIKYSGFLEPYPPMQEDEINHSGYVFTESGKTLESYDSIVIDSLEILSGDGKKAYQPTEADITEIRKYFEEALTEALADDYTLIEKPGENGLRIRAALTDVKPGDPAMNTITFIGPGAYLSWAKKAATGKHIGVGQAGLEVEISDSTNGERFIVIIDYRYGSHYDLDALGSGFSKWGHIEAAMPDWAKVIKCWLDKQSGRSIEPDNNEED